MKTFLKALALCFVATGALAQSVSTNVGGWDNGVSITPVVSTTAYSASQAVGGLQRASISERRMTVTGPRSRTTIYRW